MRRPALFLLAANLCCQILSGADSSAPSINQISLNLTKAAVRQHFGPPQHIRPQPASQLWDYSFGNADENDMGFGWSFNFEERSGRLISVTHNLAEPLPVDKLFPANVTSTATSPGPNSISVLYRALDSERLLLAMGVSRASEPCSQLVLVRRSSVQYFYPWLSVRLSAQ